MQEITDKAPELPKEITWHFIGHLQSNKAKALLGKSHLAHINILQEYAQQLGQLAKRQYECCQDVCCKHLAQGSSLPCARAFSSITYVHVLPFV